MDAELIQRLQFLASRPVASDYDDFVAYDTWGGNIDDAYYGGVDDGEVQLAGRSVIDSDLSSR